MKTCPFCRANHSPESNQCINDMHQYVLFPCEGCESFVVGGELEAHIRSCPPLWKSLCPFNKFGYCTWSGADDRLVIEEHLREVHGFHRGFYWKSPQTRFKENKCIDFLIAAFNKLFSCKLKILLSPGEVLISAYCEEKPKKEELYFLQITATVPQRHFSKFVRVRCGTADKCQDENDDEFYSTYTHGIDIDEDIDISCYDLCIEILIIKLP